MSPVNSEKERATKLAEIGSQLKQVREEKAISLEHVSAKTLIQARLLNAIEEGKLDQLPEPVYTQGFIRRFADALGLNGAEFAKAFPVYPVTQHRHAVEWRSLPAAQLRPIHLYVLYILLIVSAVSGLSYLVNRSAIKLTGTPAVTPAAVQPSPAPTLPNAQPSAAVTPANPTPANGAPNTPNSPLEVALSLSQDSWMRIIVDGETAYEGTLPAGTKRTFTAKQKLIVRAGNAGGVTIATNNTPAKPMGQPGTIEELTFQAP